MRHKIFNFECIGSHEWKFIQADINHVGTAYGIFKNEFQMDINPDCYNGSGDLNTPFNTTEALTKHSKQLYRAVIIGFGECKLVEDENMVDQYWIVSINNPVNGPIQWRISNKKLVQAILPVVF